MDKPTIICLTPVRNEAWILDRFLKAASCWADRIIVADQHSDDGSVDIVAKYPKAVLIQNTSVTFNEPERQKLLIDEARKTPGKRLLVALDADEFFSSNCLTSIEWSTMLQAAEGTAFRFDWCILQKDLSTYWIYPHEMLFAYMDDGCDHVGRKIHSPRLPISESSSFVYLKQIKVMHYAFTDYNRVKSRQRWYQCWERLNNRDERTLTQLYRFYHKDENIPNSQVFTIPRDWFRSYEELGVDMTSVYYQRVYRWDREVLELFESHGCDTFSDLAIWDLEWNRKYRALYGKKPEVAIRDPRSKAQKRMHDYLERTQCYYVHYAPERPFYMKVYMRIFNKFFKPVGW